MIHIQIIIIFLLLTIITNAKLIKLSVTNDDLQITDMVMEYNWTYVASLLEEVTQLEICDWGVSEQNMIKLFNHSMPQLRSINFSASFIFEDITNNIDHSQFINHNILSTIFYSTYFPQLEVLRLKNTNLDDRSFSFLQKQRKSNLKILTLDNCLLGKEGFSYLQNLNTQGRLQQFSVSQTLLIQSQTITSLLKLICGPKLYSLGKPCNSSLRTLDISSTKLKREGFISLFSGFNTSNLLNLNISFLYLQNQKTYKQGYNYSAFEFLALTAFTSLQVLQMAQMEIDYEICEYFINWKLHKLIYLGLHSNFMNDECVIKWIKKINLPNLKQLILYNNQVGNSMLRHLAAEKYAFTNLNFGSSRVTNEDLPLIKKLNTQHIKKLFMRNIDLRSKQVSILLNDVSFPSLQQFSLTSNIELFTFFSFVNWKKLQKLTFLKLNDCDISKDFSALTNKSGVVLPNLKFLLLENTMKSNADLQMLVENIPEFFPSLQYAKLAETGNPTYINFSTINVNKYSPNLTIDMQNVIFKRSPQKQDERFIIKVLNNFANIHSRAQYQFFINQVKAAIMSDSQGISQTTIMENIQDQLSNKIAQQLNNIFIFQDLEILILYNPYEVKILLKLIQIQKIIEFKKLTRLFIVFQMTPDDFLDNFGKFSFPNLRMFSIQLQIRVGTSNKFIEQQLIPFLQKLDRLKKLTLYIVVEDKQIYAKILNSLHLPFIQSIDLVQRELRLQQISPIIQRHNETLRNLYLNENFLQKGFIKFISSTNLILKELSLSQISLTVSQFIFFANVKTQFITNLFLAQTDLTSNHLILLINKKQQQKRLCFPSILNIDLDKNDIRKEGLNKLLESGMRYLINIGISRSNNPSFINSVLTYPNRITSLQIQDVQVYSLNTDLDPKSARRISDIALQTKSLLFQDYHILASLHFYRLQQASFYLSNIYDCQSLKDILTIAQGVDKLFMIFDNQAQGLTSTCIDGQMKYQSTILHIAIADMNKNVYIPRFIQHIMNSKHAIITIQIPMLRLPAFTFHKILQGNRKHFENLKVLQVSQNYIGDQALEIILGFPLYHIQTLSLVNNNLTHSSLQLLRNRLFPKLIQIHLSSNNFGNLLIETLQMVKAPLLQILQIQGVGLTKDGFINISKLNFPQLKAIMLSRNDVNQGDLIQFAQNFNNISLPKLKFLKLNQIEINWQNAQIIKGHFLRKNIQIIIDLPYYIKPKNAAKY